jgi:hypothetical protein
MYLDEEVYNA